MGSKVDQWRSAEVRHQPDHFEEWKKTIDKIQAAYEEGQSKLKNNGKSVSALSVLKTPLRDGDTERPDEYSGVYGCAPINFYAFNSNGNRGIACGNLQNIKDSEPLGGKSRDEDNFTTEEEDDFFS